MYSKWLERFDVNHISFIEIQFGLKREPLLGDLMLSMFETKGLPWFLNRLQSCLLDYTVVNRPRRVFCDCVLLYITFAISIITLVILSWVYLSDDKDPWILFVLLPYVTLWKLIQTELNILVEGFVFIWVERIISFWKTYTLE